MAIIIAPDPALGEEQAIQEMRESGFEAAAKDYAPGKTEPHAHDYAVSLYIIEGEFRLHEVDRGIVHSCMPGDRVLVDAGTVHAEEHGALRMVVGRRH
jgi:quercetin dioxygenase-like cupin family protein